MFKRAYNRAVVRLRIETRTPLLIRSGDPGLEPGPDLACVRTRHAVYGQTVYIPGSSLKGVLRSSAEAAVRGQTLEGVDGACDLFDRELGCGFRIQKEAKNADLSTAEIHRRHCLACRTFGSTAMRGRTSVRDHYPIDPDDPSGAHLERANLTEGRHGVAINRISGAAQRGALYDMEVVPAGSVFFGDVALQNYQAWQLGLLATAIDELNFGFAQLGSAKSRGLGVVEVGVQKVIHEQTRSAGKTPVGVGACARPEEVDAYQLLPEQSLGAVEGTAHGLSLRFSLEGPAARELLEAGQRALGESRAD